MRKRSLHYPCWLNPIIVFSAVLVDGLRPSLNNYRLRNSLGMRSTTALNVIVDSHAAHEAIQSASTMYTAMQNVVDHQSQSHESLQVIMSALYTPTVDGGLLKEAHGHTQSLFGPADPYLSSGKSIAPAAQNLIDMGTETTKNYFDKSSAAEQIQELPTYAQTALSKGWNVIDGSQLKFGGMESGQNILPGFVKASGILPDHNPLLLPDTAESFQAQVEWSANFINVFDKLPLAAFVYAVVEFGILRQGVDLYKEEILDEGENTLILAETVAVTAVRLGVFAIIAFVTVVLFG